MDIYICKTNISEIGDADLRTAYFRMSERRKKKCDLYKNESDRRRCICADMLVRKILTEKFGVPNEEIVFAEDANGKPYLVGNGIFFNVSHSADYVTAGFSEREVGIDIEFIRPLKAELMRHFCSERDIAYITGESFEVCPHGLIKDYGMLKRFFEVWTFKEAFVKRSGEGLLSGNITAVDFIDFEKHIEFFDGYVLCAL